MTTPVPAPAADWEVLHASSPDSYVVGPDWQFLATDGGITTVSPDYYTRSGTVGKWALATSLPGTKYANGTRTVGSPPDRTELAAGFWRRPRLDFPGWEILTPTSANVTFIGKDWQLLDTGRRGSSGYEQGTRSDGLAGGYVWCGTEAGLTPNSEKLRMGYFRRPLPATPRKETIKMTDTKSILKHVAKTEGTAAVLDVVETFAKTKLGDAWPEFMNNEAGRQVVRLLLTFGLMHAKHLGEFPGAARMADLGSLAFEAEAHAGFRTLRESVVPMLGELFTALEADPRTKMLVAADPISEIEVVETPVAVEV